MTENFSKRYIKIFYYFSTHLRLGLGEWNRTIFETYLPEKKLWGDENRIEESNGIKIVINPNFKDETMGFSMFISRITKFKSQVQIK
jgi:hypothetical protein